jgi:hypothetical protein
MAGPCKCPNCTMPLTCDGCGDNMGADDLVYETCQGKEVCIHCYEKLINQAEAIKDGER